MGKFLLPLGAEGEFDLIIECSPSALELKETENSYTEKYPKVQIQKRVNGEYVPESLTGWPASALLHAIKVARKHGNEKFISDKYSIYWPGKRKLKYDKAQIILSFLGDYEKLFDRVQGKGTRWLGNTKLQEYEEPSITLIETETIHQYPMPSQNADSVDKSAVTSQDNRPISPQKLWTAGRRTYEQSTADGGRFQMLHVEKRIMPFFRSDEKRTNGSVLPINITTGDSKEELSLRDALESKHGNLYLIGEGGIGKTTAMFSTIEQNYKENTYDPTAEIPLFIELNRAPGVFGRWYKGSEGMKSCFVRMEIARQVLDCEELAEVSDEMIKCVTDEFKKTPANGQPQYLLLLDGLNEVSMNSITDNSTIVNGHGISEFVRRLIIEEINYLITQCPNVRVMLTSRTDETEVNCTEHSIEKLYLTGLNKESIRKYLDSKDYSEDSIKSVLENEALVECIKIPLFLTMYADLSNSNGVASRGEILRQFFHERGENIAYTQQKAIRNLKFNQYHLWFILDFLLPAIASEMERIGEFELNARKIGSIIEPILKGWKPSNDKSVPIDDEQPYEASVIGEYGKGCFDKYTSERSTVETVAEEILVQGRNMTKVAEYVLYNVVDVLRIMYRNKNEFGFIHHHFRDFFAAAHDVNLLRIALSAFKDDPELAFESLASFRANANHQEKSIFIGEMLGEHHNKPYLIDDVWHYNVPDSEDDRNLLKRTLDLFRGRFDDDIGYGVYNLIDPIKLVRQDLSGANLSMLDLSFVSFAGFYLGHTGSCGARFQGAKVGMKNLLCQGHSGSITSVAYEPKTYTTFLSASSDSTIKEWDRATGQCIHTYIGHHRPVNAIAYDPNNGKSFLSASNDKTIIGWEIGEDGCGLIYTGHDDVVLCVAYAPDGKSFISGSSDGTIKEWLIGNKECIRTYGERDSRILSVSYSPDGQTFLSGTSNGIIKEWKIGEEKQCIHTYVGHSDRVYSIVYETNGHTFLSSSSDGTIKEWQIGNPKYIHNYVGHNSRIRSIAYDSKDKVIISGSDDGTIKEWIIDHTECIGTFIGHDDWVRSVAISPDGKYFLSASNDGLIKEWQRGERKCIRTYDGYANWICALAYAPDGKSFLTGASDGVIKEWYIYQYDCVHIYKGHEGCICSIAYAPDGKTFISGANDGTIKQWEIGKDDCICTYNSLSNRVLSLAFSPIGNGFISGTNDGLIKEWNLGKIDSICTYIEPHGWIRALAYAPDGQKFLSASNDETIKEWRVGKPDYCRTIVKGKTGWICSMSYTPDGKFFLSGADDGMITRWHLDNNQIGTIECSYLYDNFCGKVHFLSCFSELYSSTKMTAELTQPDLM